jgi:hypothetical protein
LRVVRPQLGGQRGPAGLVQRPYLLIAQHKGDKLPAARIGEQADQPGSQVIGDKSHATIVRARAPIRHQMRRPVDKASVRRGRRSASSGPVLLVQGDGYIAEPETGNLNPLPAIGRLGSCGDVARAVCSLASSRHRWALGLKSPREEVSTVKKPFGFAVVPWTVHQFSLVLVRVVPGQGQRFALN